MFVIASSSRMSPLDEGGGNKSQNISRQGRQARKSDKIFFFVSSA